jgi:hypothetical protein
MNNGRGNGILMELGQVSVELAAWRADPGKGNVIPDSVWRQAACAAKKHGVNRVSKALGLDYSCLKRRVCGGGKIKAGRLATAPAFVEVSPGHSSAELACVIELEKGGGTRMRICVKSASSVDWCRIKEAFLGA